MSDDLTAAGAARKNVLRKMASGCPKTGRCTCVDDVDALEASAAARAVDEALSVERVARALHATGLNTIGKAPGSHGKYTGQCICNMDAAALVAHLRGPR